MTKDQAKITWVDGSIDPGKPVKVRYRMATKDGKTVRIRLLDADSPDFTAQLASSFRNSVRKARKENRALAGQS